MLAADVQLEIPHLYSHPSQQETFAQIIVPLCGRYKEIFWFADDGVSSTKETVSSLQSQGWTHGLAETKNSEGQSLIALPKEKGKFVELERTLTSVVFLHWFNDGSKASYEKLTSLQNPNERLTWASYLEIHDFIKKIAPSKSLFSALEAMLIFSDAGKTPTAVRKAEALGLNKADHDDFIAALFHQDLEILFQVLPTFRTLSDVQQQLLVKSSSAMPVHLGHVLHLEGGSRMFEQFKQAVLQKQVTKELLDFGFIIQLCDVAAGLAQINNQGSISLTENTYQGYALVKKALVTIVEGGSEEAALNYYLAERAKGLGVTVSNPRDAFLVRLACWLRLYTPEDFILLQNAATQLAQSLDGKAALITAEEQFNLAGGFNLWKRNPTYGTTVILNLANFQNSAEDKQLKLNRAIEGACCMAKWSKDYGLIVSQSSSPVNFNEMAGTAAKFPSLFQLDNFKTTDFVPNEKNIISFKGQPPIEQKMEKPGTALTWDKERKVGSTTNTTVNNTVSSTKTPNKNH